jgi:cell division protein ZapA
MEPVKVKIRNQEYLIMCDEDEEKAHKIAEFVNEKLKEVEEEANGLSEKRTAILAALNIANDYFELLKERDQILGTVRQKTRALIQTIDSAIS